MCAKPRIIQKESKRDLTQFILSVAESPFDFAASFDDFFFFKWLVNKIQNDTACRESGPYINSVE